MLLNTAGGEFLRNNILPAGDNHEVWGTSAGGCIIGRNYRKQRKFRGPAEQWRPRPVPMSICRRDHFPHPSSLLQFLNRLLFSASLSFEII
jgi:hypothetical protein